MTGQLVAWLWPVAAAAAVSLLCGPRARTRIVYWSPVAGLLAAAAIIGLRYLHAPDSLCFEGLTGCTFRDSSAGDRIFLLGITYAICAQAGTGLGSVARRRWSMR